MAETANLTREDLIEGVIVGDGGQNGTVRGQCDGGQFLALGFEAFTAVMIRDNLMLNILQLTAPSAAISRWQAGL